MRFALLAIVALIGVLVRAEARADWAPEIERAFGVPETKSANLAVFAKWQDVLARSVAADARAETLCAEAGADPICVQRRQRAERLAAWRNLSQLEQLTSVHAEINRLRWIDDRRNYGISDYWATPDEFYARGGDCEDYAFAKYDALKRLGFLEDQLRILVLWDRKLREPHAILLAMVDGRLWALDNNYESISPAGAVPHYQPLYSLNAQAWWQHGSALREVDSASRQR